MNHDRLVQIIEAYGSLPKHWPEVERDAAERLLGSDQDAQHLLVSHKPVDSALNSYVIHHPAHLRARILANLPGRTRLDQWLDWLLPGVDDIRSYFWRPALAASLTLFSGLLLGNNLFTPEIVDSWEDEIVLIALEDSLDDE